MSRKERAANMETLETVLVEYDEMFCDEISIKLLYQHKNKIEGFVDENNNQVSKSAVADWIMENYYNDRKFVEYCKERKGKILETAEQALLIPLSRMRIRFSQSALAKKSMQKKQSQHISRLLI